MHNNPVEAGFVLEPYRWKHRRAIDFSSGKGILDTDFSEKLFRHYELKAHTSWGKGMMIGPHEVVMPKSRVFDVEELCRC
jgi:hypothetical protein